MQSKAIASEVYRGGSARNGSISAEHGIGLDKHGALIVQLPAPVFALMRSVKNWLDPTALLNPGKVVGSP